MLSFILLFVFLFIYSLIIHFLNLYSLLSYHLYLFSFIFILSNKYDSLRQFLSLSFNNDFNFLSFIILSHYIFCSSSLSLISLPSSFIPSIPITIPFPFHQTSHRSSIPDLTHSLDLYSSKNPIPSLTPGFLIT